MEFKKHYSLILFLCLFCVQVFAQSGTEKINVNFKNILWGIERSGFFNGRGKWAKGFENQRV